MAFRFPFSTLHELNLDWILEKVKYLVENNEEFNNKADYAVETADEAKEIAEEALAQVIPDGAITTAKLADDAVTSDKIEDDAVTSDKIADGSITLSKFESGTATFTRDESATEVSDWWASIVNFSGPLASLVLSCRINLPADGEYYQIGDIAVGGRPLSSLETTIPLSQSSLHILLRINAAGAVLIRNSSGTVITGEPLTTYVPFIRG